MGNMTRWMILHILGMVVLSGCVTESVRYRTVTDGMDRMEYYVVGSVTDGGKQPISNCKVFLSKEKPVGVEMISAGVTDFAGHYQLAFEIGHATEFWLHFDAKDQGYPIRYESISHLLTSSLYQYTGNTPIIVNVIINKNTD